MSALGIVLETRLYPILVGALVGLVTGFFGMVLTPESPFLGGMLGAVGGGVTAAYLSNEELLGEILNAAFADIVSSVVFFGLVFGGILTWYVIEASAEADAVETALGTMFVAVYGFVFGSVLAVPIAAISLVVAVIVGTVTSVLKRRAVDH